MTRHFTINTIIRVTIIAVLFSFATMTPVMADDSIDSSISNSDSTDVKATSGTVSNAFDSTTNTNNENTNVDVTGGSNDSEGSDSEGSNEVDSDSNDAANNDPNSNDAANNGSDNNVAANNGSDNDSEVIVSSDDEVGVAGDSNTVLTSDGSNTNSLEGNNTDTTQAPAGTNVQTVVQAPAKAPKVTVTDFGVDTSYTADSKGNVKITGIMSKPTKGASYTESFVIYVDGNAYPVTVFEDGSYYGTLPQGFMIRNFVLYISGVNSDMDIMIEDHTALSGISTGPFFEEPYLGAPVFEAPAQSQNEAAQVRRSSVSSRIRNNTSALVAASPIAAAAKVDSVTAAEKKEEVQKDVLLPADSDSESAVLGAETDPFPMGFAALGLGVIAVIALIAFALRKRAQA